MKTLSCVLLFVASLNVFAELKGPGPSLSDQDLKSILDQANIKSVESTKDFTAYALDQDSGKVMVSKIGFTSQDQAQAFCKAHAGFQLTDFMLQELYALAGGAMPFPELRSSYLKQTNVVDGKYDYIEGFWFEPSADDEELFNDESGNVNQEKQNALKAHDYFATIAFTKVEAKSDVQILSKVNARLQQAKQAPIQLPAICIDQKLTKALNGDPES